MSELDFAGPASLRRQHRQDFGFATIVRRRRVPVVAAALLALSAAAQAAEPGHLADFSSDGRSLKLDASSFEVREAPGKADRAVTTASAAAAGNTLMVAPGPDPVLSLGVGDAVNVTVFGRPEFNTTTYLADDATITVPLAGKVKVGGLSPADAGLRIAEALRKGQYLINPQVTVTLNQHRSQQVSVLGEVDKPGRFPLESRTTVLDLLAQAGGVRQTGANTVYLLRPDANGQVTRHAIDLKGLTDGSSPMPTLAIRSGDSLFVPKVEQFYVYGEVKSPNMYRLEPGTTVVQAISRSGGLTLRGSDRRIEIRRKNPDGSFAEIDAKLTDSVQPDDVIRVKERIF